MGLFESRALQPPKYISSFQSLISLVLQPNVCPLIKKTDVLIFGSWGKGRDASGQTPPGDSNIVVPESLRTTTFKSSLWDCMDFTALEVQYFLYKMISSRHHPLPFSRYICRQGNHQHLGDSARLAQSKLSPYFKKKLNSMFSVLRGFQHFILQTTCVQLLRTNICINFYKMSNQCPFWAASALLARLGWLQVQLCTPNATAPGGHVHTAASSFQGAPCALLWFPVVEMEGS